MEYFSINQGKTVNKQEPTITERLIRLERMIEELMKKVDKL